jgi:hypothetical protein
MKKFRFEDFEIWQDALSLTNDSLNPKQILQAH